MSNNDGADKQKLQTAVKTIACPDCRRTVKLVGRGRRGQEVKLTGSCPIGHWVACRHVIR